VHTGSHRDGGVPSITEGETVALSQHDHNYVPQPQCEAVTMDKRPRLWLRECIDRGMLNVAVQPIIDLRTSQPVAGEVLLRPAHHLLSNPARFIELAVAYGMLGDVTRAVVEMVERLLAITPGHYFMNLHPRDLEDPNLPALLGRLDPTRITLEITESHRLLGVDTWKPAVRWMRQHGFLIALDDLGEGHSSLVTLAELRPDRVKLGRGIIAGCHGDAWRTDLLEHIANFCRRVGVTSIAEGVETYQEAATVARVGIDWAQGFRFARPALVDLGESVVEGR
jgi:EAL domain-containing protein (putative c-di-GMP-specific phosphodiesterase class I)